MGCPAPVEFYDFPVSDTLTEFLRPIGRPGYAITDGKEKWQLFILDLAEQLRKIHLDSYAHIRISQPAEIFKMRPPSICLHVQIPVISHTSPPVKPSKMFLDFFHYRRNQFLELPGHPVSCLLHFLMIQFHRRQSGSQIGNT